MTKLTKFLALLLAMLLCFTAFAACSNTDDEEDEDENEDDIDFSDYKGLSPDEVWDEVRDADHVKITFESFDGDEEITIIKDRQNAKIEYNGIVNYLDFSQSERFVEKDDGTYEHLRLTDEQDWEFWLRLSIESSLTNQGIGFFLEDDWFEKSGSIYSATIDTLENFELEAESVSAYMNSSKTSYSFICDITQNGEDKSAACKVLFDDFTVKMPNSSDVIDPFGTTTPQNTTGNTPATDKVPTTNIPNPNPDQTTAPTTEPPVTNPPDTPVYPQIPEGVMTPSQLFDELYTATDATILVKLNVNGATVNYEIEKDGDVYSFKATTSGVEGYLVYEYYDLASNLYYYIGEDGNWYYIHDTYYPHNGMTRWNDLISQLDEALHGTLLIGDSFYQYDADLNRLVLNSDSCNELELRSVTLKQSGEQQILSIVNNDFSTSSLNAKFSVFSTVKLPNAQPTPNA